MSILSSIGKRVPNLRNAERLVSPALKEADRIAGSLPTKTITAGLAAAAAMHGFGKGLSQSGAGDAFYEMTTGNPNIDEEVLGTNLNPASALLQLPGGRVDRALNGVPGMRSGVPRLLATLPTGFVNTKTVGYALSSANKPFSQMPGSSNPYMANTMPSADGSLVFGLNNARHGG